METRWAILIPSVIVCLSACQTNPPEMRRAALLLADEIDAEIVQWGTKITAEKDYYRKTDDLLRRTSREAMDLDAKYQSIFRLDAYLDQALVEKKGVSLTGLREFLATHNDRQREADKTREAQTQEAEQKTSVSFAKLTNNRSALEEVSNELRIVARQDTKGARTRQLQEWSKRFFDEAKKKADEGSK